ncbi:hypothetical protein [Rariglobus hedericola]|uniref:DUF2336 domain-containing protein n=1 Tax=Rariglobus hedericola TaxID=2597822 RepID=A0A556QK18_9BACT|nr:hypothetical protein [Rariglobus hedericola]TSJ76990.1 hypothetical protein FPL22_12815 [Rariglobus hedericola]
MSAETLTVETLLARIRSDGVRRTSAALRKPPIPSRLLQDLAALPNTPEALEFVASYPLSPSHLLETLAVGAAPAVLAHLATNPRTPPHLMSQFAAHENAGVRAQAAAHPQLPARELFTLTTDADPEVRRSLAGNSSLRLPHQAVLVVDADPSVRLRLAAQSALPAPAALVLGADACAVVRVHTVASVTAEEDLLLGWAAGDEEDVQLALLQRKALPAEVNHTLLRSPHAAVRRLARTDLDLDDVDLLFLATRGEPDERAWVAARPQLSRPLQSLLARDSDLATRTALAANLSLDETIARYFTSLAEETVCEALAGNPAMPSDLVEELAATRQPAVLAALAYRENLSEQLVQFLLVHSPDFRRHWAIQGRTDLRLDLETAKILLADPLPTVRVLAVSACPAWRRADMYDLARDAAPVVRIAALRHANAPDELLQDRATDSSQEVADAAREVWAGREANARQTAAAKALPPMPPVVVRATPVRQTAIDVAPPRPTVSAPPRASAPATSQERPEAPDLLNKLKRIFWQ